MPLDGNDRRLYELNLKGVEFQQREDFETARVHYMAALLLEPNNPVVLGNLAAVLYKLQKYEMGIVVGRKAIRLAPNDFMARNNLAINLVATGLLDEARTHINVAMKLKADELPLWHTRGTMFFCQNKFEAAEESFAQARRLGFDAYPTQNDQAIAQLALGRIAEGLELYEVRWEQLYRNPVWNLNVPEWKGENLDGKTIIANAEQGFGDTIQFCRFVPQLQARGAKVLMTVQEPLVRLLGKNFPDIPVYDCENFPESLRDADYHVPMLSLLRRLGITTKNIDPKPYLGVESSGCGFPGRIKVGLCWASGNHGKDLERRRRILPFEELLPLIGIPGIQVVSLQLDENRKALYDYCAESLVIDPMSRVEDFYDTASIIATLDLVITVDSAVAHLAGALGKPTIVLGPRPRCWRWWNQPSGEPWYQNMQIYDQDVNMSWRPAIRRTIRDVENLASKGAK